MKHKPLTTTRIAYNNLCGKLGRSLTLAAVVAIIAFALFGGAVLSQSLENGIVSLEARLGADIAIVPSGSEDAYEATIISGAPVNFYIDSGVVTTLESIPGVAQITPQFYLATVADAECCSIQTQLIGIDYHTDFAITPWISEFINRQIGDGEVIVGSNVVVDGDNTVTFFGHTFTVAARLTRTATGMDSSVYLNMGQAIQLAYTAQSMGFIPYYVDVENAVSTVLINVAEGYDINRVADNIRHNHQALGVVASYGIYASIANNLRMFTSMISSVTIVLGVLAVLVLGVLFSLIASGRKKEFAILRILGATRKKLASIVLAEALDVSLIGALAGIAIAAVVVFPFGAYIGGQMGMPILLPTFADVVGTLLLSFMLAFLIGPVSSAYSAYKISRAETYATMREGE